MKTIRELLSGRPPITLPASATALEAARKMAQDRVGALLIADEDGSPLGVFTERDLMTRVVVAGSAGGAIETNRHNRYGMGTPLANLWLSMAQIMGVETERFADSTGPLTGLRA